MPSNIPGGSSSGSAVAVAAELVDFAIGLLIVFHSLILIVKHRYTSSFWSNVLHHAFTFCNNLTE